MKKNILISLLLLITTVVTAQEFYLETGKTSSTFKYENSQGQSLDNLQSVNKSFMAVGYQNVFFSEKLNWSIGANYTGYGAIGSLNTYDTYLEWDANYLEFDFGLKFRLFKIKKASIYIKGNASAGFIMQGYQTINNITNNLKNIDDFSNTLFNFKGGAGLSHPISRNLSFFIQYMYGKSSDIDRGNAESLNIKNSNFSFGLLINLSQKLANAQEIK